MDAETSCDMREATVVARRARNAFLGAMLICWILALHMTQLRDRPLGQIQSVHAVFGPLLLWALTVAAYAFHAIIQAYGRLEVRMDRIVASDDAKAQRLISRIRARLSLSDGPPPPPTRITPPR
jgi:hypothetical protein